LLEILYDLKDIGIIFENNPQNMGFSTEEIELYSRNINFFAWIDIDGKYYNYWDVQKILKESSVLILGAGGTGSIVAQSLSRLGIGELTIVDYDVVELNNLNRQMFNYSDLGKEKTSALKNQINQINPYTKVETKNIKIENINDLEVFYESEKKIDLVISCIDSNDNINQILEIFSKNLKCPIINGGYASTIVTVGLFDYDHKFTNVINNNINSNYDALMVKNENFWSWENAVISPVSQISGNLSVLYAFYYLSGLNHLKFGEFLHIDLFNLQNKYITYSMDKNGQVKDEREENNS